MEALDYWRLCDRLTVIQAAQLLIGVVPGEIEAADSVGDELTNRDAVRYRTQLDAATTAITNAIRSNQLPTFDTKEATDAKSDWMDATILVDDLRTWLRARGLTSGFFFPSASEGIPYLDRNNSRYAPKLAAAVKAWLAVEEVKGKHPKQALLKWLREHAAECQLCDEDGKANETGIEECAKVANWKPEGGAPKSPGGKPTHPEKW
jgi:hypothetical protein